jgi:hypothetical protein
VPIVNREPIYAALYALLQTAAPQGFTINTFSRRFQSWDSTNLPQLPALFMQEYEETADQDSGDPSAMGLYRWISTVNVWIYFSAQNPNALPDQVFNALVDSMETVMQPSPQTGRQTLGGLVTHAWIDGRIMYSDGALDKKAVILLQVKILWGG